MRTPTDATIIGTAERITAAIVELADAYRRLLALVDACRQAAYAQGGVEGASDIAVNADRIAAEIAGALRMAGFDEVLHRGRDARPVADLVALWTHRVRSGALRTSRQRPRSTAFDPLPGQKLNYADPLPTKGD